MGARAGVRVLFKKDCLHGPDEETVMRALLAHLRASGYKASHKQCDTVPSPQGRIVLTFDYEPPSGDAWVRNAAYARFK